MNYNVIFEIEIDSDSPLNAAKKTQTWLRDVESSWCFEVQDSDDNIFSVDLSEPDKDAVIEQDNYIPLIN